MKTKLISLSIVAFILLSCGNSNTSSKTSNNTSSDSIANVPTSNWTYNIDKNEMDDTETAYANIEATEKLNFDFPYGEETVTLTIRHMSNKNEVLLWISNGQFLSNMMGDRSIKVRFDDEKAQNISYIDPSDGSSTVIFISNPDAFINRLKSCKRLLIESEFFNEGNRTMKFETDDFQWKY